MSDKPMDIKAALFRATDALGLHRSSNELAREQFLALARQVPILYSIIILNSFFVAFAVWDVVGTVAAFAYPVFALPIMIFRCWKWQKWALRTSIPDIKTVRRAIHGTIIISFGASFLLSTWAVNIMWAAPTQYGAYIPLFTILCMITCGYCLASLPLATYAVTLTGSLFIGVAMLLTGNLMMIGMAVNIMIVSTLVIYMVSNQFAQFRYIVDSRSKMVEQRAHATHLAHRDQLTDMPNRRAFIDALLVQQRNLGDRPVAVVMIDMNGFKPINDTYGHAAGDKLLINAGQSLTNVVGKAGIAARLGGDEFAVLFTNPQDANWVHDRVLQMLYEMSKPILIDKHEIRLAAAFGIAYLESVPDEPMDMVQHADMALYDAKQNKTSAISFFEGSMENRVRRRTIIEHALADEQQMANITMHFQPIFELKSGHHVGFEALARWEHPDLGTISPTEFVGAAERSGLATKLTIHLFEQALKTACKWPAHTRLSFNLSGSGLGTSHLDSIIPAILTKMNFNPARLSVEITETALLSDTEVVQEMLRKLQALGIRIVLDDFGAGYASIGYLQNLQFDGIKLDGSLIQKITHDARSRDLLIGVLYLCQAIRAEVTAEMVESEEQLALLRPLPIDFVQGYLLGGPVGPQETYDPDKFEARTQNQAIAAD
jgi:diguanylate cyclase (GGDEF)-like protein